ncbi:50S ribosomal protein L25/general stress protein Ctc [Roseivirga seohaensis]|uniref:Large ribosomal subunit protein bL25 n=2 Tax=Roseivirga seohaensis TaxID=1914963 RepID=A0A0L8AM16_9BACT|nr:50S ribosomal protein L25/general stress protein Ctc [Roseivirga seohaensis]KOF03215.1 50S ribosomal protein L25 [Roseivirga seohaensis subsp. aquiponti]KYG79944.1 50S ribosomal protein L25/general stress protein Ctc [Roseivirga seohaensis]
MRKVEIIGFKRANLGKTESKRLRNEGQVPCVLYGGDDQLHFYAPAIQFRDVLYTPEPCFVTLNVEGEIFEAIVQDSQYHPVSDMLLHVDFLQLFKGKYIKMEIPVKMEGTAPGVINGGSLVIKKPKLLVKALPKDMPDSIPVDISKLKLGKSTKVGALNPEGFEIQNSPLVTIATVTIPRALRGAGLTDNEEDEESGEEGGSEAAESAE